MKKFAQQALACMAVTGLVLPAASYATNGMNLEGYGPIALGMGGTSFAYDNGTAAVMNNPATLGLMKDGRRFDLALGFLGPDVTAEFSGMSAPSSADAFYMPAVGWVTKQGQMTYGVAMFAQGGMGTEYDGNSFMAAGSGETVRSEVGVGRLMAPIIYNVNKKLSIGGTIDFVWAGMDIKMAMSGQQLGDMVADFGGSQASGTASGSMVDGLVGATGTLLDGTGPVNWTRFDFSNSSDFTGEAFGTGFAAKLGFTYKVDSKLVFGGTYHTKTSLDDLDTSNAKVTMNANVDTGIAGGGAPSGTYAPMTIVLNGDIKVKNFEWPAMLGFGAAYRQSEKLLLVADIKQIKWADVLEQFNMAFKAGGSQEGLGAGFANTELNAVLFQKWDDQTVVSLGGAYQVDASWTVRAGYSTTSNPIPDKYLNALFPANVEDHLTFGAGYKIDQASNVNFALSLASEVSQTATPGGVKGVTTKHSQTSWQLMYSYLY